MWRVCVASIVSGDGVSLGSIFFVDLNTTALERSMLHFGRWGRRVALILNGGMRVASAFLVWRHSRGRLRGFI